jgi:PAS domain S-box-containing protein
MGRDEHPLARLELQHALLQALPDLVWLKDPDGVYLACNTRFEQLFGAPQARIVGRTDRDFLPPELADFFRQHDLAAMHSDRRHVNEESVTFASDGHSELLQTIKTAIRRPDGSVLGVLGIGRDIGTVRRVEQEYRALFAHNPAPMLVYERGTLRLVEVNEAFLQLYGYRAEEIEALRLPDLYVAEERERLIALTRSIRGLVNTGEWHQQRRDGSRLVVVSRSHDIGHEARDCRVAVMTDVTRLHRAAQRDRSRLRLLESLARGDALPALLEQLAHDHEALFPRSLCSILLLDESGTRLLHGAAPSLPDAYNQAVHGLPIGPQVGSCGAAASLRQRVIAADLQTHPNWTPFRDIVAAHGLAACWSEPVVGVHGRVLGTFAVYRRTPGEAEAEELEHLSFSVQLASTAITQWTTTQQLHRSERQLRDILHAIPDLVWLKDPDGVIRSCNAAFAQLVGRPEEQIVGHRAADLLDADTVAALDQGDTDIFAGRAMHGGEFWLRAADGQRGLYEAIKTPLHDDRSKPVGVLGVARDITLIRQGARALVEQKRLIDTMFGQTTDSIVLFDPDTLAFVTFNDAAWRGLGYTREAFAALQPMDLQFDLDEAEIRQAIAQVHAGTSHSLETRHRRANGGVQHAMLTLQMLRYSGRPLVSAVWRDITESRQHEARIHRLNQAYAVLSSVNEAIVRLRDPDRLYAEVCRIVVEIGGFRLAWIGQIEGARMLPLVHAGHSDGYIEQLRQPPHDGQLDPSVHTLLSGTPAVVNDIAGNPRMTPLRREAALRRGYRASATFPITVHGRVRCCLSVYTGMVDHFDTEQVTLYSRLAQDVAFALELRSAETTTRQEQLLREQMMESVAGLFFVLDRSGRVVMWNRRLEEVTGYAPEEIRVRLATDYFLPEERAKVAARIRTVFDRGESQAEAALVSRDGRRTPYLFVSRRIDLDPPLVVCTGIDISDRVRSERELAGYRQHLETLVATRTAELERVNVRLNREDQRLRAMLSLSQKASTLGEADLLQCGLDEAMRLSSSTAGCLHGSTDAGRTLQLLACIGEQPESIRAMGAHTGTSLLSPWEQVRRQGRALVLEAAPPDGTALSPGTHRMAAVPIVEDKTLRFVLCAAGKAEPYDETDVRELELIGIDLWRIIRRRRIELALEQAKATADAASQAKSAFLANMSHEIRTPMIAIIGFAHLLRRDPLTPRQREHLGRITDASQHLLEVINDILDFSKIEAHKVDLETTDFDPRDSIGRVVAMLHDRARAKQLVLAVQTAQCPPALRADRLRLEQVLLNLIGNAVKFTLQGRIEVRATALEGDAGSAWLRFEVEDSGVGIAPEQIAHLFAAFEQADVSTTRRFGGTGLGLAISKRLVELMHGRIGVSSAPGRGSLFWFELPLLRPQPGHPLAGPPARPAALSVAPARLRRARVLLVEDNPINQEVAAELLLSLGLQVDLADDGAQAVERFSAGRHDLILMDVQMPVMDGLRATAAIRRLPGGAYVTIIALTASAFQDDRAKCMAAGMDDFLGKPVEPGQLHRCLMTWLGPAGTPAASAAPVRPLLEDDAALQIALGAAGLDVADALARMGGDGLLYRRSLRLFVAHHHGDAAALRDSTTGTDLRGKAHAIAGVAGTLGARDLHRQARAIERAAGACGSRPANAGLQARANRLADALEWLLGQIDGVLGADHVPADPVTGAPPPESVQDTRDHIDWPHVRALLAAMQPLLAEHDTAVLDLHEQAGPVLERALGPLARALAQAIGAFDFEVAQQLLAQAMTGIQAQEAENVRH